MLPYLSNKDFTLRELKKANLDEDHASVSLARPLGRDVYRHILLLRLLTLIMREGERSCKQNFAGMSVCV